MITKKGNFDDKRIRAQIKKFKRDMPIIAANLARNHFLAGFRKGGGQTDKSKGGWRPRKGGADPDRALLVKSGNMRGDIKIRRSTFKNVTVAVRRIPYAQYHNNGTGRSPQREFIGRSLVLERRIDGLISRELLKITG